VTVPISQPPAGAPDQRLFYLSGLITIFLLAACAGGCAPTYPAGQGPDQPVRLPLEAMIATSVDSSGRERPEVLVTTPYRSLVFLRGEGGFRAEILVAVVATRGGERVGGGRGQAAVAVADFEATQVDGRLECRVPVQVRGEGPAELEVTVQVVDTSRYWRRQLRYRPQNAQAVPLYFASFGWNLAGDQGSTAQVGILGDSLRARVELGRRPGGGDWPDGGLDLLARIAGTDAEMPRVNRIPLVEGDLGPTGLNVELNWSAADLPFGPATLQVELEATLGDGQVERLLLDPPREFLNLLVPWWDDRAWRLHLGWLEGVVSPPLRQELESASRPERLGTWRRAWRAGGESREPASAAETVHMLRIVEADRLFGTFGRGATSDRGRVYIRYGPPDKVESYEDDLTRQSRWEVWYLYAAGLQFTFNDPHGLGDFHLYASSPI